MCDTLDVVRGKDTLSTKELIRLNQPARRFLSRHRKTRDRLVRQFKNQLDDSRYSSVPSKYNKYTYYYTRDSGKVYGKYAVSANCGDRRVILDCEALSKGHKMWDVKETEISNNEEYIAFTVDTDGDGLCKLFMKEYFEEKLTEVKCPVSADSSCMWPENVAAYHDYRNAKDVAFSSDSRTLYYVTCDHSNREDKVWMYDMQTGKSVCMFEETDEIYSVYLSLTDDREYPIVVSRSKSTADSYIIMPDHSLRCVFKRSEGLMVYLDHYLGKWYAQVERGAVGEILVSTDLKRFQVFYGYKEGEELGDIVLKGGFVLVTYMCSGENRLNVVNTCTGAITRVKFRDDVCSFWFPSFSNMNVYSTTLVMGYETYLRPLSWITTDLQVLHDKHTAVLNLTKSAQYTPEYPMRRYDIARYGMKKLVVNKIGAGDHDAIQRKSREGEKQQVYSVGIRSVRNGGLSGLQ